MKPNTTPLFVHILIAVILAACSTIEVNNNYDPGYDFSSLKDYAWIENPNINTKNPLIEKQFRREMETQLKSKGYSLDNTNPNFHIAYHGLDVQRRIDVTNWGYGYGRWGSGVEIYQYDEGTIVIDFIDAKSNELIYRSKVSAIVKQNIDIEKRQKNIQEAVHKILENFPSKK